MAAGVYLHIPFCKSRCSYCDFATDVWRSDDAVERYVAALCNEIRGGSLTGRECVKAVKKEDPLTTVRVSAITDTIYFGGGTPSLLSPRQVERILNAVRSTFDITLDAEITMEMNPATVTPEKLKAYREVGINRASFGVQTFNDRDLKLLARGHDANDARNTFTMLRDAGFENVSFDLIAGLPGQSFNDWSRNLDEAIAMEPEHISLYLLEIHEGTPLAAQIRSERRPLPDEDLAADMYELMLKRLSAVGYEQYEISNFAKLGKHSHHNIKYWQLEPVYGFGVSAHSFDGRERYANHRDTTKYVTSIENGDSPESYREKIETMSEYVFLGLRLTKGIDLAEFKSRFGIAFDDNYHREVEHLKNLGLIEIDDQHIKLTRKGMLFSNEVFSEFV